MAGLRQLAAAEHEGRDGHGAARLGDKPGTCGQQSHGREDLLVRDRHYVVDQAADMQHRQLADLLYAERVGNGSSCVRGGPGDPAASSQRVPRVGRELRLDSDDQG